MRNATVTATLAATLVRGTITPKIQLGRHIGFTHKHSSISSPMTSIATLERIDANRLADLLLAQAQREIENQNQNQNGAEGSSIAIVDVRDDGE